MNFIERTKDFLVKFMLGTNITNNQCETGNAIIFTTKEGRPGFSTYQTNLDAERISRELESNGSQIIGSHEIEHARRMSIIDSEEPSKFNI